jgi:hypothetical protein
MPRVQNIMLHGAVYRYSSGICLLTSYVRSSNQQTTLRCYEPLPQIQRLCISRSVTRHVVSYHLTVQTHSFGMHASQLAQRPLVDSKGLVKCRAVRREHDHRPCGWLVAFAATEFANAASASQTLRRRREGLHRSTRTGQQLECTSTMQTAALPAPDAAECSAPHDCDEDLQKALQRVASGLAKSGNTAASLSMLGSLRREFPDNVHYHAAAARLLVQQGHLDAARRMASEAIGLQPDEPGYLQVRCLLTIC